jgi:uncharacterized protein YjbI with pentapeptide repeats
MSDVERVGSDTAIAAEREAALRAAYEANIAAGKPPYAGVRFQSKAELEWVIARRGWDVTHNYYVVKYVLKPKGATAIDANLREAILGRLDLSGIHLRRADLSQANLVHANLSGADLVDITLDGADMGYADLHGANLHSATLAGAHLREASLADTLLRYTNLRGARLFKADLSGADLVGAHFDADTVISQVRLDGHTRLRDVGWGGALLSHVAWELVPRLGDEIAPRSRSDVDHLPADPVTPRGRYRDAARAYQQLAAALRAQGMDDVAGRYAYRAQTLRRKAYWREGALGRWLFSWLLATLAGYGYKLQRILITYLIALTVFALIYFVVGLPNAPTTTPLQQVANAYLVSLTAIHGRTFFEQFGIGSGLSWVAAVESVCGLVIEAVFTSMLVQRFFAR